MIFDYLGRGIWGKTDLNHFWARVFAISMIYQMLFSTISQSILLGWEQATRGNRENNTEHFLDFCGGGR